MFLLVIVNLHKMLKILVCGICSKYLCARVQAVSRVPRLDFTCSKVSPPPYLAPPLLASLDSIPTHPPHTFRLPLSLSVHIRISVPPSQRSGRDWPKCVN
jgi:hypothetical protein